MRLQLSPNALRALDHIGKPKSVLQNVKERGYHFDILSFVNTEHQVKDVYYFGQEKLYGYHGFRIYRQILIEEMVKMLRERNIPIHYDTKYEGIVSEDASGVTFTIAGGKQIKTDMLIGCDGIHSRVRKYLFQDTIEPKFGGLLAITSHIPTKALRMPTSDYPLPATIQGKTGAFVIAPQDVDGSECLVGTQRPHPALDRQGWADLTADKAKLVEMFTATKDSWNDLVQSAMEEVAKHPENVNIWPYHQIPRLDTWMSGPSRVIIIGDAAHAIPPSAGQGVNQAFEDAESLAAVLARKETSVPTKKALDFWQEWRQARCDKVNGLTASMNNKRLPEAERAKVDNPTGGEGQLAWLYQCDLTHEMEEGMKKLAAQNGA